MFYLMLAMKQYKDIKYAGHYNIGPNDEDCISTGELVKLFIRYWEGATYECVNVNGPHEANFLKLDSSKAKRILGWSPIWNVEEAIKNTVEWYRAYDEGKDLEAITDLQIEKYEELVHELEK